MSHKNNELSLNQSLGLPGQGGQERGNSSLCGRLGIKAQSTDAPVLHDESQPRGPGPRSDNVTFQDRETQSSRPQPIPVSQQGQGEQERGNSSLAEKASFCGCPRINAESTDAPVVHDQKALSSRHQLYTSGSINTDKLFATFGNNHLLPSAMGKDSLDAVKTPRIIAESTDAPVLHDESRPRGPGPTLTMTEAQARGVAAFVKKVISNVDQGEIRVGDNICETETCEAGLGSDNPKYDEESEFIHNECCNFSLDPPTANTMEELLGVLPQGVLKNNRPQPTKIVQEK